MAQRFSISKLLNSCQFRPNRYFLLTGKAHLDTMAGNRIKSVVFENLKDKVLNGDIILIDVREPNELKDDGKIPNSVNIPLAQVTDAFQLSDSEFLSKYGINKPSETDDFVFSCRSGKRATNALNKILPLGYKNVLVYTGSFQDWLKNGGPIEK